MAAIVSDKDHGMMARELCRGINYAGVIVTSVGGGRQLPVDVLAEEFRSAGQSMVEAEPDPVRAYETALRKKGGDILVCAGSLYLAGGILDYEKQHKAGTEISNAEL
jgi:folylpolyglutamate synthase/dihydropteroate synthase